MPELDNPPPLPPELAYVLAWFAELSAARGSNGFAPNPITYAELDAWARLVDTQPTPFEVAVLRDLDSAYLRSLSDGRPASNSNHRG